MAFIHKVCDVLAFMFPYLFILALYTCFMYDVMYMKTSFESLIYDVVKTPAPEYLIVDMDTFRKYLFQPKIFNMCTERGSFYICYK